MAHPLPADETSHGMQRTTKINTQIDEFGYERFDSTIYMAPFPFPFRIFLHFFGRWPRRLYYDAVARLVLRRCIFPA